jgi:hypothetical protein
MSKKLKEIFRNYIKIVQSNLPKRDTQIKTKGPLRLFINIEMILRDRVYQLESTEEFDQLIVETENLFSKSQNPGWSLEPLGPVQNFFRQSGSYIDIFDGKNININELFDLYCRTFNKLEVQTRYLIPIDCVGFGRSTIDFKSFRIKKFNLDELNDILKVNINKLFYPHAITNSRIIKNFWFLDFTERESTDKESKDVDRLESEYRKYPKVVDSILKKLLLYNWHQRPTIQGPEPQQDELEVLQTLLEIPFWLKTNNNLLSAPNISPDFSTLWIDTFVNDQTGEEEYAPFYYFRLDDKKTEIFKETLQHNIDLYEGINFIDNNWLFFEVALRNFYKGFFSSGMDQIFWYLIALEALLGERKEGITDRIGKRIGYIIGESKEEREVIKEQFTKLYGFRCDLVHGNIFKKEIYERHNLNAYNMCWQVILWFLNCLNQIQSGLPSNYLRQNIQSHKNILTLVDPDLPQNKSPQLRHLIEVLPGGFPHVSGWIK